MTRNHRVALSRIRQRGQSYFVLSRWLFPVGLWHFPAESPTPPTPPSFPSPRLVDWVEWREAAAIPAKTPFLLAPNFGYDVALNSFFLSGDMLCRAWNTRDGYARDLKAFLNFLWHNRNRASWRDATTADHLAYLGWRFATK